MRYTDKNFMKEIGDYNWKWKEKERKREEEGEKIENEVSPEVNRRSSTRWSLFTVAWIVRLIASRELRNVR